MNSLPKNSPTRSHFSNLTRYSNTLSRKAPSVTSTYGIHQDNYDFVRDNILNDTSGSSKKAMRETNTKSIVTNDSSFSRNEYNNVSIYSKMQNKINEKDEYKAK